MNQKFKTGDVVHLKSNPDVKMTVQGYDYSVDNLTGQTEETKEVICRWLLNNNNAIQRSFNEDMLELG
jgi:uncharacterized protein YodC (DUF2158 family)